MKKKTFIAAIFSVALLTGIGAGVFLIGSSPEIMGKVSKQSSSISKIYKVGNFDRIGISGNVDVRYVQGSTPSVVARGQADLLKYLTVDVTDGKLTICFTQAYYDEQNSRGSWRFSDLGCVKIVVTSPQLDEISASLSADFNAAEVKTPGLLKIDCSLSSDVQISSLSAASLHIDCSNSGDVDIAIARIAEGLTGNVSTSGDVVLKQASMNGDLSIDASTSGDLKIMGIDKARQAKVNVSTSGSVKLDGKGDYAEYSATTSGSINARTFVTQKARLDSSTGGTIDYNSRYSDSETNRNFNDAD